MSIIDEAKKKLHSENGSSLLIALLLFFVCLILSMSILSAAVASRVRIKDEKEKNQELLCLESAIGVLTEGFGNIKYYRRELQTEPDGESISDWQNEEDKNCPYSDLQIDGAFNSGTLAEKLKTLLDNLQGGSLDSEEKRFSIYLEGYDDKVYIRPKVEDDYYLAFYVGLKRENGSYDEVYKISYNPDFSYFGSFVEAGPDGQTGWYRLDLSSYIRREFCVTWKEDSYVIQRVVN